MLKDAHGKAAASLEKPQLDLALCESLTRARKWDELLIVAKRLASAKFFVKEGFHYAIKAARGSKRWADLEVMAHQQLVAAPENTDPILAMATAKSGLGDHEAAIEWIKKLIEPSLPYLDEQIFAAWQTMLAGDADQETLGELKRAQKSGPPNAKYSYTLAMVQAVLGMPEDAQQSLRTAIDQENFDDLAATPWVIYGKICELYGFPEEAAAAFERAQLRAEDSQTVDDQSGEWAVSLIPSRPL
jgi:tetratricopeptide (TPR) repeat protein